MTEKIRLFAKRKYFFIYLLPVFFVVHGFTYNYNLVNVKTTLWVLAIYLVAAYCISRLGFLFFKDRYKAHLFTFSLLFINFFFGYMYEGLNNISKTSFFAKYSFLLPFTALLIAGVYIWMKRKKNLSHKLGFALNIFLFALLLVESGWLVIKLSSSNKFSLQSNSLNGDTCNDCNKPDIYFILTDGYAGQDELKNIFGFDNSGFDAALAQRGFHVIPHSRSNYNFTVLSMASVLNMSYLNLDSSEKKNISGGLRAIRNSLVSDFLKKNGYQLCNNSIFKLYNEEKKESILFPGSTSLLLGNTLLYHFSRIIEFKLYAKKNLQIIIEGQLSSIQKSNELLYDKTIELVHTPSDTPRFIYTHLLMPHFPYFFDKNGRKNEPDKILFENRYSKKDFLEYQQYTNKILLALVDTIQQKSKVPPIIILQSDHGFRQFKEQVDKKYYFCNLSAVYLPGADYSGFYDGMSNVNIFRTLLNTQFKQHLEMLKDSSIYLEDTGTTAH